MSHLSQLGLTFRAFQKGDLPDLYSIFQDVNKAGNQFPWLETTSFESFSKIWHPLEAHCCTAILGNAIVGGYSLKPQWPDRGSHIVTGVYMVSTAHRRLGIGYQLGLHSQQLSRTLGYQAMQYNLVVSTNQPGLALWEKLGFRIVGRLPHAYRTKTDSFVDALVLYRMLE